jgi:hypothetical protein
MSIWGATERLIEGGDIAGKGEGGNADGKTM